MFLLICLRIFLKTILNETYFVQEKQTISLLTTVIIMAAFGDYQVDNRSYWLMTTTEDPFRNFTDIFSV